jgi:hypothetical protein
VLVLAGLLRVFVVMAVVREGKWRIEWANPDVTVARDDSVTVSCYANLAPRSPKLAYVAVNPGSPIWPALAPTNVFRPQKTCSGAYRSIQVSNKKKVASNVTS